MAWPLWNITMPNDKINIIHHYCNNLNKECNTDEVNVLNSATCSDTYLDILKKNKVSRFINVLVNINVIFVHNHVSSLNQWSLPIDTDIDNRSSKDKNYQGSIKLATWKEKKKKNDEMVFFFQAFISKGLRRCQRADIWYDSLSISRCSDWFFWSFHVSVRRKHALLINEISCGPWQKGQNSSMPM